MGMSVQIRVSLSFQAPNMERTRSVPTLYFWTSFSPAAGLSCDLWGRKACGVFLNYCCAPWKELFCNCSLCRGFEELEMQTQEAKSNLNNLLFVCFLKERSHTNFVVQPWRFCHSLTLAVLVCVAAEHLSHSWETSGMFWLCSKPDPGQQCCSVLQTWIRPAVLLLCTPSEIGTMFQVETKREFFFQA